MEHAPFPPSKEFLRAVAADLREIIQERRRNPNWRGGSIPSRYHPYFANANEKGEFKNIVYQDGPRKEIFGLD